MFTNHDLEHGRSLYAAEVMADPEARTWNRKTKLVALDYEMPPSAATGP